MWIPRAFVALTTVLLCTDAFAPSALRLCGSGASFLATKGFICNKRIDAHSPSMSIASGTRQRVNFVDEAAELEKRAFPIPPQELVEKAKAYLAARGGFQADPEMMASNFQFMGPVVGPLSKAEFVSSVGRVDLDVAFPDLSLSFYDFRVDAFEGNRVWYTVRGSGTNSGPLPPFAAQPTNRFVDFAPQCCSLTFNAQGLVTKYTIGYVIDRTIGNTGGLGGLYGVLYAIGKPLPFREAQPWQMSRRNKLFNFVGTLASRLQGN